MHGILVLSIEEKLVLKSILKSRISVLENRSYVSDSEFKELRVLKHILSKY